MFLVVFILLIYDVFNFYVDVFFKINLFENWTPRRVVSHYINAAIGENCQSVNYFQPIFFEGCGKSYKRMITFGTLGILFNIKYKSAIVAFNSRHRIIMSAL